MTVEKLNACYKLSVFPFCRGRLQEGFAEAFFAEALLLNSPLPPAPSPKKSIVQTLQKGYQPVSQPLSIMFNQHFEQTTLRKQVQRQINTRSPNQHVAKAAKA